MIQKLLLIQYSDLGEVVHIQRGEISGPYRMHTHDFYELVFVESGCALHRTEHSIVEIERGDCFILRPGIAHGFEEARNLVLHNIMFDISAITENRELMRMKETQRLVFIEPVFRRQNRTIEKIHLTESAYQTLMTCCTSLMSEQEQKRIGYRSLMRSLFYTLIIEVIRDLGANHQDHSGSMDRLAESIEYIEQNYTDQIRLDTLAEIAHLSKRHYSRSFRLVYHTTPIDYITRLRMKHALELLTDTDKSITMIAFESGFSDSNYFSRVFKTYLNTSPREYRTLYKR